MERRIYVNVGFKRSALTSDFNKDALLAEADAFENAVGLMLNALVPVDFYVDISTMSYGFMVEIGMPKDVETDWISTARKLDSTLSEDDAKQNLWNVLGSLLQHVDDMVNNYGIHFGKNLMLFVN